MLDLRLGEDEFSNKFIDIDVALYLFVPQFQSLDILKVDNLWQFNNLVKLQLDNNIIEKIEGLDTLAHLVWLGKLFNFKNKCIQNMNLSSNDNNSIPLLIHLGCLSALIYYPDHLHVDSLYYNIRNFCELKLIANIALWHAL